MRSSTLALLILISVQAAVRIGGDAQGTSGRNTAEPSRTSAGTQTSNPSQQQQQDSHSHPIPVVDPKLFNKRRYRSPRVLFSAMPPGVEIDGVPGPSPRVRRKANKPLHRGEYSVCDSVNRWVDNKTRATDMAGNEVTVLPNFNIENVSIKQYFFETTCRGGGRSGASGCRGIDGRHWNSYCSNTHTFVRALTSFQSQVAWRYIRINTACVCVLSRKSWRH
ncbi:neurotrophin-7-like [Scleropages formosus]|uniref:Neurotrophin-7-like n=1 Tax=Scleropages formosus TaxID=113540 RepID=A0A0P7W913_SCLFO|nr:neurotrophin-7-like [Scleropages formosus]XP_018615855.1 neurotrophin-7-like [Scleropages formosus]KPP59381.1 neurotrophin-7-like [Scleropages formosus]